jgi:putative addiction module killer protein
MPRLVLRSYVDEDGRAPFEAWILDLDSHAQAKVTIALSRLESGNLSNVEAVGSGVSELRLNWGRDIACISGRTAAQLSFCCAAEPRSGKAGI